MDPRLTVTSEWTSAIALTIFISYFLVIIALFNLILRSLPSCNENGAQGRVKVFAGLAIASFAHTWFYMFKFIYWSFSDYEASVSTTSHLPLAQRVTEWLLNTQLFEQAWATVSFGPVNWWWSEQLCLFTVGAWTVFLVVEGGAKGVKRIWAYMLLGQLVAISVAANLFYLALILSPSNRPSSSNKAPAKTPVASHAPPLLWTSVLVSLATIAASPHTTETTFLPNLLVMHTLLMLPLIFTSPGYTQRTRLSMPVKTLYAISGLLALLLRAKTTVHAAASVFQHQGDVKSLLGFASAAWATLHSHPAQASIGWDVIWTSGSFGVWASMQSAHSRKKTKGVEARNAPWALSMIPLVSVGAVAPYLWSLSEDQADDEPQAKML